MRTFAMIERILAELTEEFGEKARLVAFHFIIEVELEIHGVAVPEIVVVPTLVSGIVFADIPELASVETGRGFSV